MQRNNKRQDSGDGFMPRGDRSSLVSRLNSLRLTYIRRVPRSTRKLIAALAAVLAVAIIAAIVLVNVLGNRGDKTGTGANKPYQAEATLAPADDVGQTELSQMVWGAEDEEDDGLEQTPADGEQSAFAPDTSTSARAQVASSQTNKAWQSGAYVPDTQGEGYLPVFLRAGRKDKVISVVVYDCDQANNLKLILDMMTAANGRATLFPIAQTLQKTELQELLLRAYGMGCEIENHTWSHSFLYDCTDDELAKQIFNADRAVDLVLGVDYQMHFLRPRDGNDRNDIRTHAYLNQLGYYGIAHWSVMATGAKLDTLKDSLAPGEMFAFHCTDEDVKLMKEFLPYALDQGYQLVTMNALFGYEENAASPLTDDPRTRAVEPLGAYEMDYRTMQNPTYSYLAYQVQAKLIELGYMEGTPDGIYGKGSATAAAKWQQSKGYTADGVLLPDQLRELVEG